MRHNQGVMFAFCYVVLPRIAPPMKSNYSNTAKLKDLMTVPPMTAAQHAEVMRKRIAQRHMVEEAREQKRAESVFEKR